jgi:hypothetical protein
MNDELLHRIRVLREHIREIAIAALTARPTKACDRLVAGLFDSLNGIEAMLSVSAEEGTES